MVKFSDLRDLEPGTYWVWNLAYDIEGMLRDVRDENGWAARRDGAKFEYMGGKACYYHGKRFDWSGPNGRIVFIEASSFFGRIPLRMMGSKDEINAALMSEAAYRENKPFLCRLDTREVLTYQEAVDNYCVKDARIVYDAICELDRAVKGLGVDLGATPGATARRFMNRMGKFPRIVWQTQQAFLRSYCGGRFEITKRGVLHDVRQYDIVSAYPYALSKCPWLTGTAYYRNGRRFSDDALYGSYCVSFATDEYLGLAPRWHEGVRIYANAQRETWLARPEVDWLQRNGYDFTIHRAIEVFDENATDLWGSVIYELFADKQRKHGTPEKWGPKIVMNSQYGVLIQLVQKNGEWMPLGEAKNPVDFAGGLELEEPPKALEAGKYYAPLYAGNLTAITRVMILEAGNKAGPEHYIGGHTDSVLATKKLDLDIGDGLGQWELEQHEPRAEIGKTGMYAMGGKIKMRGITRDGSADMLWQDTHIRNVRMGIKRAGSWDDVSVISARPVANNYKMERKRKWHGELTRELIEAGKFIDSEALRYVS